MDQRSTPARSRDQHRYRGRRRAPAPPLSRYIAVATAAVLGAGVVALGAGTALPDLAVPQSALLATTGLAGSSGLSGGDARRSAADRAARDADRGPALSTVDQPAPDVWLLPLREYQVSSGFGQRWGVLHPGTDLAVPEGTPFYAAHAGTVALARWNGGYGNCVIIDVGVGVQILYGHSSRILVGEGQRVAAGDLLALAGDTGYSYGSHVHFEVRVNGRAVDPVPFMRAHGVDIPDHVEAIYSGQF